MSAAGEHQVRSWQTQRFEQFVHHVLGKKLQEKRAPSQPFEGSSRGDRIDKALHTGKVASDEPEVAFRLIQFCLL